MRNWVLSCLFTFLSASCGGGGEPIVDAATPVDAGTARDAGVDAGPPSDAGGSPVDAGAPNDAGGADASAGRSPRVLLFGNGNTIRQETWIFDGATWESPSTMAIGTPGSRGNPAMVGLPDGTVFLHGGLQTNNPDCGGGAEVNDSWSFDGSSWELLPVRPACFGGAVGAAIGETAVFGAGSTVNKTWIYDGTSLSELMIAGPEPRTQAVMASIGESVVTFGGRALLSTGWGFADDTWIFNGSSWSKVEISGPSPRIAAAMGSLGDRVVLFGGRQEDGTFVGDTWIFDGSSWTELEIDGPSGRSRAAMASLGDRVVLYGGWNRTAVNDCLEDTWMFDGSSWTEVEVTGPGIRCDHSMATLY